MEKQAAGTKQRSYTEEYKRGAAALVRSTGRTATTVAAEIGVHPTLLCRWVRRYASVGGKVDAGQPASFSLKPLPIATADQAAEIARLRRENERLRMERDILKRGSPSLRFRPDEQQPSSSHGRCRKLAAGGASDRMRFVKVVVTFAFELLVMLPMAHAQFLQAFQLDIFCRTQDKQCPAFIAGVFDTITILQDQPANQRKAVCAPSDVSVYDMENIWTTYLMGHKDETLDPAARVLMNALAAAYPCN